MKVGDVIGVPKGTMLANELGELEALTRQVWYVITRMTEAGATISPLKRHHYDKSAVVTILPHELFDVAVWSRNMLEIVDFNIASLAETTVTE